MKRVFLQFVRTLTTATRRPLAETPLLQAILTDELQTLFGVFEKNRFELKIAGGAVRDLLMQVRPHDVDLATDAKPEQMLKMFEAENIRVLNLKGLKHGTVPVRVNDKANYEITTLRIDVQTYGRHAEVEFTNDWHADAIRRDLTVNALFLEKDGTVIDYVNGVEDLRNKLIRFVGVPDKRVKEDYLRILRYFRFYSRVCESPFEHDPASLKAIKDNVAGLELISGERIGYEFRRILAQKFSDTFMKLFYEFGMQKYLGLPDDVDLDKYSAAYQEIFGNELRPLTLLAFLFRSKQDIEKFRERIKLSNEEYGALVAVYSYQNELRKMPTDQDALLYLKKLLVRPYAMSDRPLHRSEAVELLKAANKPANLVGQLQALELPKFALNREDLLNLVVCDQKLTDGRQMTIRELMVVKDLNVRFNQLHNDLKTKWADSDFCLTKGDLLTSLNAQALEPYIVYKKKNKKSKK